MATSSHPDSEPDLDTTSETRAIAYQEVPNNHLSPMGQVDEIGRFARGAGPERLTRWFRRGILVLGLLATIAVIVGLTS